LVLGDYTRRVHVVGVVVPEGGLTRLVATQAGRVTALHVKAGDSVAAGDVLYVVGIDSTTSLGNTQNDIIAVLRSRKSDLESTFSRQDEIASRAKRRLSDQVENMRNEARQVEAEIVLLEQFTSDMKDFVDKQRGLVSRGVSVSRDYESRLQSYNTQRLQLEAMRRSRLQLQSKIVDLGNELSNLDLDTMEKKAAIRQQLLELDQNISQSEALREVRVMAPRAGTVTGITTLEGQTVSAGTPLLTIVPKGQPLVAQLLAPTNAIGFVNEGSDVLLRYEAFPYQKFGQFPGKVSEISRATLRPEEVVQLNAGGIDPQTSPALYRITVKPEQAHIEAYGRLVSLQAGMRVDAHILGDTRPLYQWVLEPIYSLRGSVADTGQRS